jgi:ribosome-associated protein
MANTPKSASVKAPPVDADLSMEDVLGITVRAIEDKKGEDVLILDLTDQLDYLDYMIICTGRTEIHNRAISDAVEKALTHYDIISDGLHGRRSGDWILIDYGVMVVHIFLPVARGFYRLEELWAGGEAVELN